MCAVMGEGMAHARLLVRTMLQQLLGWCALWQLWVGFQDASHRRVASWACLLHITHGLPMRASCAHQQSCILRPVCAAELLA